MDFNSTFKIQKFLDLSGEDNFSLTRLYMPIIGVDSFSMFSYLYSLNNNESYTVKILLDALNFPNVKYVENAFAKLEAICLITMYYSESKGYMVSLKTPLKIESFFANPLLNTFINSKIGIIETDKIRAYTNPSFRGYKDISKKFDEVYETSEIDVENIFNRLFLFKVKDDIKVKNDKFDYILFKMSFDSDFIDEKILEDEELKNTILNVSFTYDLNEEEMKDVILKTISIEKDLKVSDLSKHARKLFQEKNKAKDVTFVTKEADAFVSSSMDDDIFKLLSYAESIGPSQLLRDLSNINPSVSELKMIEDLTANTKFTNGIINIMLLYVLKNKNGELPGYNYFEKIANSWARKGVKTTKDAIELIKKQNELPTEKAKTDSNYYNKKKKSIKEPDWYKEYEEKLKNRKVEVKYSDEELEEALEKSKDLFK